MSKVKKDGQWAFLENGKLYYEKEKLVFTIAEQMPMFKKCSDVPQNYKELKSCADKKLLEHISQNIYYPEEAISKKIEGMVVISFIYYYR